MKPMFCEQCHRIERDPIMLDTETCSQCGGYLAGMDDGDGQPDEITEWRDFDADCYNLVAPLVALAEAGIPADVQELLVQGDPMRGIAPGALAKAIAALATPTASAAQAAPGVTEAPRVKVPDGQTPLDNDLRHRLLDVFAEGEKARETGAASPYHGQTLEHCLHASGWVHRDLRLALDAVTAARTEALGAQTPPEGAVTEAVRKALIFYENHGAGCRLVHSGGDASRHELAKDGGKRAKDALAALASPAGERPAVVVEKLEWGQHDPRRDVWFAETPFGDYFVGNEASDVFRWKFSPAWPWSEDFYATADAAKAAAQADYERRIRSALTAETHAVPEGMVLVPQSALDWLMGAGPDHNGNWFGEGERGPGAFWWRSKFTAMCRLPSSPRKEGSGDA